MTLETRLDRLEVVVESLAASVIARDNQLDRVVGVVEKLAAVADKHSEQIAKNGEQIATLQKEMASASRLFEAYLKRLPPQ